MKIIMLDEAEEEIAEIHDFLEGRRVGQGEKFLAELERVVDQIERFPDSFPEYYRRTRLCTMRRYKYGVFFEVGTRYVYLNAVIDLRRSPRYIRKRLR